MTTRVSDDSEAAHRMEKRVAVKGMNYMMTVFNSMFTKDVDLAYEFLKQEMKMPKSQLQKVPVRLADGKMILVDVGTATVSKTPLNLYR